jgi:hypothetical protein
MHQMQSVYLSLFFFAVFRLIIIFSFQILFWNCIVVGKKLCGWHEISSLQYAHTDAIFEAHFTMKRNINERNSCEEGSKLEFSLLLLHYGCCRSAAAAIIHCECRKQNALFIAFLLSMKCSKWMCNHSKYLLQITQPHAYIRLLCFCVSAYFIFANSIITSSVISFDKL